MEAILMVIVPLILLFLLLRSRGKKKRWKYCVASGEMGEQMVARELSRLPDTYTVINDFRVVFSRPIPNKQSLTGDRIQSVQIDHVVVGPTGLFLVETKNWSHDFIENEKYFSPVAQLTRSSYAMFVVLNNGLDFGQKISPRGITCFINGRGKLKKFADESQYVKVLSRHQLSEYIRNQRQVYTQNECRSLSKYMDTLRM